MSNLADGVLRTSVPLLATTLTKDPFLISLISALVMLPWLLFAIPIGGIVDRINRRKLLATANTIRLSSTLILAITIGLDVISFPILLLATFLFGIGEVVYDTTAQSMVPEVLEKDQLDRANARLQVTAVTLGEFMGAPLGGILVAVSIALPFFFGAFGVVIAILLVFAIPLNYSIQPQKPVNENRDGFWKEIRFGIRYLYEHKMLLKLVLLTSSIGFFFSVSTATLVLFFTETLATPTALFGFMLAAPAVGALIGSILTPRFALWIGRTQTMAWSMVLSSILVIVQGFSPNYWVLAALMALGSAIITAWNILLMSTYHQVIPADLFGRIHGTRRTLVWGLMPIGSIVGGLVAAIDLRLPFFVGGGICTLLAIFGFRFITKLEGLSEKAS